MRISDLHKWLGELIRDNPAIADCGMFGSDGDELREDDFHWCDHDGGSVGPGVATEVTLGRVNYTLQ